MKIRIQYILIAMLMLGFSVSAQDWIVPDDQKNLANPLPYNLDNVKKGKELFLKNCKSCHGDPGKNNALPLVPPPVDITSEKMQKTLKATFFTKSPTAAVPCRSLKPQFLMTTAGGL